jgi:hypothetical protein
MADRSQEAQPTFRHWAAMEQHGIEVKKASAFADDALHQQGRVWFRRIGIGNAGQGVSFPR